MSLFKAKTWWECRSSTEEETDLGCLCVANIDNSPDGKDKIIVGSFQGILHIFCPQENKAHETLLEVQLEFPILQICAGKFVSVSPSLHLAVLHPRRLVVYEVVTTSGTGDQDNQCQINKVYEHNLERSAANMIYGPFGGVKDKDYICVQSLDGALLVFENENFSFTRFFSGFLLPGPIAYSERTDCVLTVSSNWSLEAYSFQVLALATDSNKKDETGSSGGKKVHIDWSINLGESAVDMKVVKREKGSPIIAVLGERNLFFLEDNGKLQMMKKMDYKAMCFHPYQLPDGTSINTLVCTTTNQLLVYNDTSLKWAAMCETTPVQITTGNFNGVQGMIVTLSEDCHVACSYLGTQPSLFHLAQSNRGEVDYPQIQQQLQNINTKIKDQHSNKSDTLFDENNREDLVIEIIVPSTLDRISAAMQDQDVRRRGFSPPSITVQVRLNARRRVNDVQLAIQVEAPFKSSVTHTAFTSLADNDAMSVVTTTVYMNRDFPPSSMRIHATVNYQQVSGAPHVSNESAALPLLLVATPDVPDKSLLHKITFESNKPCVDLLQLFPELAHEESASNIIGMKMIGGPLVTILTSSTSSRYRVQCETYAGLWLASNELHARLHSKIPDNNFKLTCTQGVNLEELAVIIDRHFMLRQSRESVKMMLEQRAKQFRSIQRRLLTRFKDKTPTPLACLDTLLEGTHRQILALTGALEENSETMMVSNAELGSALHLTILIARLWLQLNQSEVDVLVASLSPNIKQSAQGWEETVDVSVTALLRTVLSRNKEASGVSPSTNEFQFPMDTSKIKKHVAILFDRLSKGARLISRTAKLEINRSIDNGGPISNISIIKSPMKVPSSPAVKKQAVIAEVHQKKDNPLLEDVIKAPPTLVSHEQLPLPTSDSINSNGDSRSILGFTMEKSTHSHVPSTGSTMFMMSQSEETGESLNDDDPDDYELESPAFYDNSVDEL